MSALTKGARSAYALSVQRSLLRLGHKLPRWGADGVLGDETLAAFAEWAYEWGYGLETLPGDEIPEALAEVLIGTAEMVEAKRHRTRFGLVVHRIRHLRDVPSWVDLLVNQRWDFVSLKIIDNTHLFDATETRQAVSMLHRHGVPVHGWGYHYCASAAHTEQEAWAAAAACVEYGIDVYHWDAEIEWKSGPDPPGMAKLFAERFRAGAPGVTLVANCFSSPLTAGAAACYDGWEPQLYGTRISTIARKWDRLVDKFGDGVDRYAMVGTGRVDAHDNVWGFFGDRGDVPGLRTLVKRYRPVAVSFYRAPLNWLDGNDHNPSVAEQLQILQEDAAHAAAVA